MWKTYSITYYPRHESIITRWIPDLVGSVWEAPWNVAVPLKVM